MICIFDVVGGSCTDIIGGDDVEWCCDCAFYSVHFTVS